MKPSKSALKNSLQAEEEQSTRSLKTFTWGRLLVRFSKIEPHPGMSKTVPGTKVLVRKTQEKKQIIMLEIVTQK